MKKSELKAFGIIGGDKRQLFLAKSISDCCYDVILGGFDKLKSLGAIEISDIKTAISKSDAIIFPLPSICADGTVNTPFSDNKTRLDEEMISLLKEKPIFVAMKNKFLKAYPQLADCEVYDYSAKEEFAVANALLTAEGAVEIAMNEYEGTIFDSKCLVCGFGRIGKMLAKMLKSLNAQVTVSARNEVDFAYIEALGCKHINTNALKSVKVTLPTELTTIDSDAFGYLFRMGGNIHVNDFKIYGYKNTAAEKYAQDNEFEFIALDDEVVTGDSNQDGIVNVKDVTYLQRHLAGSLNTDGSTLIDETSKALFDCLDLNKDGKLTVADVTELQVYISTKG